MIETVVAVLGANALVLAALTFLIRSIIAHRLEKDLSEFKRDVELAATREIEAFKAQLEKDRLRLQISYGGIFEKQADAILEMYRKVIALENAASAALNFVGEKPPERERVFYQSWASVRDSYQENRILLPEDIDGMLDAFIRRMYRSVFEVMRAETTQLSVRSDEEFRKLADRQDKAYEIIETQLPAVRERLVADMRRTIGVVVAPVLTSQ